jgi:hypothetical protein
MTTPQRLSDCANSHRAGRIRYSRISPADSNSGTPSECVGSSSRLLVSVASFQASRANREVGLRYILTVCCSPLPGDIPSLIQKGFKAGTFNPRRIRTTVAM